MGALSYWFSAVLAGTSSRFSAGTAGSPFCQAMTFTEPGALGQSELQVEGAMKATEERLTFLGAPLGSRVSPATVSWVCFKGARSHQLVSVWFPFVFFLQAMRRRFVVKSTSHSR